MPAKETKPHPLDIRDRGRVLVADATGNVVRKGDALHDFRGDLVIVVGGQAPRHAGSTGRIWTRDGGEYFPSVINCHWEG